MHKRMTAITGAVLVLGGCATVHRDAVVAVEAGAYLAIGTEPFWSLEITDGWLTYNDVERRGVRIANPGARHEGDHRIYVTDRIAVRIVPGSCSDGMSERRYADSVSIRIGNGPVHLSGCGGPVIGRE